jgi:Transposase IS4
MLMGVHHMGHIEDYWNCSEDKPVFPLQSYMSRQRFEQFTRYLKINSPHDELDDAHYWHKVEPLSSSFREASQATLRLGDTINIDENLYSAKTRSKHIIQIDNKAAGKGYKAYTLCTGYYVWDFLYTSKVVPVPEAEDFTPHNSTVKAFTDTERVVLTLVKRLLASHPPNTKFRIAFDNFFTSHKLYEELRHWDVGAFGTAKAGSGMPRPHVRMREVCTKEVNYGEIVNTIGKGGVNFVTFVDQKAVWMMSTVHDVANEPWCWRPSVKRSEKASTKYARTSVDGELQLRYPLLSYEYNHWMNGSDLCQQVWNYFTTTAHPHSRNWWPLLWMIIDASIANVLYIFRLKGFKITHTQLQERLGLQLLRNPASVNRKRDSRSFVTTPRPSLLKRPADEHQWERISRRYCVVCKPPGQRRGLGSRRRAALKELGINTIRTQPLSRKRKRGKSTRWGCYQCNVALCHTSDCWQRHHNEDKDETDNHSEAMSISSFDED